MAIKAIDINEEHKYILKCEQGLNHGNKPTIWVLGVLDSLTLGAIEDQSTQFESTPDEHGNMQTRGTFKISQGNLDLVRHGLKGFENFIDSSGNDVPFYSSTLPGGKKVVQDKTLMRIPKDVLSELADQIGNLNRLMPDEEKKIKSRTTNKSKKASA